MKTGIRDLMMAFSVFVVGVDFFSSFLRIQNLQCHTINIT